MNRLVLGDAETPLAVLIAEAVPAIAAAGPEDIRLILGTTDLEDGFDESYIHARVVELLDAVRGAAPSATITLVGFPDVEPALAEERRRCEASARMAAELRGIRVESAA